MSSAWARFRLSFTLAISTLALAAGASAPAACDLRAICYALDQSGSISDAHYEILQKFTVGTANEFDRLDRPGERTEYSAVAFSFEAMTIAPPTSDLEHKFVEAVQEPRKMRSSTNIFAGLRDCYEILQAAGTSDNKARALLLVTDGHHNRGGVNPIDEIKKDSIAVVTVGVGNAINETALASWATKPEFFVPATFQNLSSLGLEVVSAACGAVESLASPSPASTTPPAESPSFLDLLKTPTPLPATSLSPKITGIGKNSGDDFAKQETPEPNSTISPNVSPDDGFAAQEKPKTSSKVSPISSFSVSPIVSISKSTAPSSSEPSVSSSPKPSASSSTSASVSSSSSSSVEPSVSSLSSSGTPSVSPTRTPSVKSTGTGKDFGAETEEKPEPSSVMTPSSTSNPSPGITEVPNGVDNSTNVDTEGKPESSPFIGAEENADETPEPAYVSTSEVPLDETPKESGESGSDFDDETPEPSTELLPSMQTSEGSGTLAPVLSNEVLSEIPKPEEPSPSITVTPSVSFSSAPSASSSISVLPSSSTSPTTSSSSSATPSSSAIPSTSPSPSASATPSQSAMPSTSPSPSASTTPSQSAMPSTSPSASVSMSSSASATPSESAMPSASSSPSVSISSSVSATPSTSAIPSASSSPSASMSSSVSMTPSTSAVPSTSSSPTASMSSTVSATPSTSSIPSTSPSQSASMSSSASATSSMSAMPSPSSSVLPSLSNSISATPSMSALPSVSPSPTISSSASASSNVPQSTSPSSASPDPVDTGGGDSSGGERYPNWLSTMVPTPVEVPTTTIEITLVPSLVYYPVKPSLSISASMSPTPPELKSLVSKKGASSSSPPEVMPSSTVTPPTSSPSVTTVAETSRPAVSESPNEGTSVTTYSDEGGVIGNSLASTDGAESGSPDAVPSPTRTPAPPKTGSVTSYMEGEDPVDAGAYAYTGPDSIGNISGENLNELLNMESPTPIPSGYEADMESPTPIPSGYEAEDMESPTPIPSGYEAEDMESPTPMPSGYEGMDKEKTKKSQETPLLTDYEAMGEEKTKETKETPMPSGYEATTPMPSGYESTEKERMKEKKEIPKEKKETPMPSGYESMDKEAAKAVEEVSKDSKGSGGVRRDNREACLAAYSSCKFRLVSSDSKEIAMVNLPATPDKSFSGKLVFQKVASRSKLGVGTVNMDGAEFIDAEGRGVSITAFGTPNFVGSTFKYAHENGGLAHQVLRGTQLADIGGRCVRVWISDYQLLDSTGNVAGNIRMKDKSDKLCVVFQTAPNY